MKDLFLLVFVVAVLALSALTTGCSKEKGLGLTRPCLNFEKETARGKTEADVKSEAARIAETRIGCQEATVFSVALGSALFQEQVQVHPDNVLAAGKQWCSQVYRSGNKFRGCLVGVEESLTYYPVFSSLLQPNPSAAVAPNASEAAVRDAFARASRLITPIVEKRRVLDEAVARHQRLHATQAELSRAQAELGQSRQGAATAENRYFELDARRGQIFIERDAALVRADRASRERAVVESRVSPLQRRFTEIDALRLSALNTRSLSAATVSRLGSDVRDAESRARRDWAKAAELRRDAPGIW